MRLHCEYKSARGERTGGMARHGFTLIELLIVIVVIVIIMTLSTNFLMNRGPRAERAAEQLGSAISMARSHATANNRIVWLQMAPTSDNPHDLQLRYYFSPDGSNQAPPQFRNPTSISNIRIRGEEEDPAGFEERPVADFKFTGPGMLVFTPTGEVFGSVGVSEFPLPGGTLNKSIEIGIQATDGGVVGRTREFDIAALHVQGISANTIVYTP